MSGELSPHIYALKSLYECDSLICMVIYYATCVVLAGRACMHAYYSVNVEKTNTHWPKDYKM